jgi:hypothetical protein
MGRVSRRWIYSACLCFALDLAEQRRSGFSYGLAVYQLEYSRMPRYVRSAAARYGDRRARRGLRRFGGRRLGVLVQFCTPSREPGNIAAPCPLTGVVQDRGRLIAYVQLLLVCMCCTRWPA